MKKLLLVFGALVLFNNAYGQIDAKLMQYMDVSDTQITFVYGGDIWVMPKTGGLLFRSLTHPEKNRGRVFRQTVSRLPSQPVTTETKTCM